MKIVHDDGQAFELTPQEVVLLCAHILDLCSERDERGDHSDSLPEWSLFDKLVEPAYGPWYKRDMLSEFGKEKLLALAEALETQIPAEEFDMDDWDCGMTACAIGWGIRLGVLPGMVMDQSGSPGYKCLLGGSALASYFGSEYAEMTRLFVFSPSETTREVAGDIRKFVEEHHVE